jgi:hypothetical protein
LTAACYGPDVHPCPSFNVGDKIFPLKALFFNPGDSGAGKLKIKEIAKTMPQMEGGFFVCSLPGEEEG